MAEQLFDNRSLSSFASLSTQLQEKGEDVKKTKERIVCLSMVIYRNRAAAACEKQCQLIESEGGECIAMTYKYRLDETPLTMRANVDEQILPMKTHLR